MNALVPLTGLVFQGIVLSWIRKLERQCNCSEDWRRDFIKVVAIIGVIMNILVLVNGRAILSRPAIAPLGILGLVNIIAVLTYIPALKKKACACAIEDDWRDNFIFWWVALSVIFMVVGAGVAASLALRR